MIRYKTPNGQHERTVARAVKTRSRRWLHFGTYNGGASAGAISWMIRNGKGLKAVEAYAPGTFDAQIRDGNEVWIRRA